MDIVDGQIGEEITFSATFPLPFRVLVLGGLGILGWAANLHGLHLLGIDATHALELSTHQSHRRSSTTSPLPTTRSGWKFVPDSSNTYRPVYKLFTVYSLFVLSAWTLYRYATGGNLELVDVFKFVPGVATLGLLTLLVSPFDVFEKRERDKFLLSVRRCITATNRIYFADVVFADIFTSFAKVLGDLWLSLCMLLPAGSLLYPPPQEGLARWILPTIMSIPYAVRFRQCLVEYLFTSTSSKRPLFNAIKYATSFPVIYLSAAQRHVASSQPSKQSDPELWFGESWLFNLWLIAAAINSLYSFWWDVTFDWGCDLLRPSFKRINTASRSSSPPRPLVLPRLHSRAALLGSGRDSDELVKEELLAAEETQYMDKHPQSYPKRYPFGLRPTLLLPLPIYPFAIVADLILRLTWSAKLSSHLHSFIEGDRVIFLIESAEVFRRWMWVFLRVEWEVVKERDIRAAMPPGSRLLRRAPDGSMEDEYEMLGETGPTVLFDRTEED